MKIYFVRHGQTKFNALNIHQHKEVPLSPEGLRQAKFVASRFKKIPVDVIISSNYFRAKQTATEIQQVVKKKIFYTSLIQEAKRPSEIEGKYMDDPEAVRIKRIIHDHREDPHWHYSDEENYYDVKQRALEFLQYITRRKEEHIVVVTHGLLIRLIVGLILFGQDELSYQINEDLKTSLYIQNTGITICDVTPSGKWRLITWNDFAHLGE